MAVQRIELGRGDLWKSKAKALQLRLRDRFRVVVDRHRRRPHIFSAASDGYFSSTVQRWLNHFRDFRRDSLHSPSAFYRKRGHLLSTTSFIHPYIHTCTSPYI